MKESMRDQIIRKFEENQKKMGLCKHFDVSSYFDHTPAVRTFDGARYEFASYARGNINAQVEAGRFRERGFYARVIRMPQKRGPYDYQIWIRKKQ
jgi:hypothetical protein